MSDIYDKGSLEALAKLGYDVSTDEKAVEAAMQAYGFDRHHAMQMLSGKGDTVRLG